MLLAILALVTSLASKTVTLPSGGSCVAQAAGDGIRHQKFEGSGPEWSVPVAIYVPELWPVEIARVIVVNEPLISSPVDQTVYIRPPPA